MVGVANKKANSRETRKESQLKINESNTRDEADMDEIEETSEKGKGRGTTPRQGKKESVQSKKQKTQKIEIEKIDEKDEMLNNDEEDAEQDEEEDGDEEEEEEEESEEVESIAQRRGKRSVKQKFVITKGTRVQLKEDKDMEEKLSVKKKLKGKKQKQALPAEIVSKPSKQIHKEKEETINNIPQAAETPSKRKAESEKDQHIAAKQPLPASSKKKEKIEIKAEEKLKKISVAKQLFDDSQIQQESYKLDKNFLENDKQAKNKKKKKDNLEVMLEKKNAELSKMEKKAAKKDKMLEQVLKKIEQIKKEQQQQGKSALSVLHSQCVNELFEEGSTGSLAKDKQQLVDDGKINEEKLDKQNGLHKKKEEEDNHDEDDDNNDDEDDEDEEDDDDEEESVQEIRKSNRRPAKPKQYADYDYQQKNKSNNKNNKAALLEELQSEAEQLKSVISEIKSKVTSQIEEIAMISQNVITSQVQLDNSGTPPQSPQISNADISSTLPNTNQNLPAKTGRKAAAAEKLNTIIAEESSQNNEIEIQKIADSLEESILSSSKQPELIEGGMKVPKKRGRKPKNAGSSDQNGQDNSGEKDKLGRKNQGQPNRENLNLLNLFIQEAQKIQKNPTPENGVASATELTQQSLVSIPDGDVAQNEPAELPKKHKSHSLTSEIIEKKQSQTRKDSKSENDMDEMMIEINVPNEDAGKIQEKEVQKDISKENTTIDEEINGNIITPNNHNEITDKSQIQINNDNKADIEDAKENLETKEELNQKEIVSEGQCSEAMVSDENVKIEKNKEIEKLNQSEQINQENSKESEKQNVQLDKQEIIQGQIDGKEQNLDLEDTEKLINNEEHQEEQVSGQEPSQEIKENEEENLAVECLTKDDDDDNNNNNDQDIDFNRQQQQQQQQQQDSLNMSDVLRARNEESIVTQQNQKEDPSQVQQLPSLNNEKQQDLLNHTKTNQNCNSEESKLEQFQPPQATFASSSVQTDSTKQTYDSTNTHTLVNNDFKYPENYDGDCQQLQSNNQICCSTPKKEKQSVTKKISESSVEKRSPPSSKEMHEQQCELLEQAKISPNNNIKNDYHHKTSLDAHNDNPQLISLEEQRGQDMPFASQNHYVQMEIENTTHEQLKQQHIPDMSSVDKARMEFEEEENFFDDLTPISMPEESAHGTKDIAFDKIPQVRSLILQQQSQQYAANKSSYSMQQQQQQFTQQQQYLQQQQAASLSMKAAGKQKTYR